MFFLAVAKYLKLLRSVNQFIFSQRLLVVGWITFAVFTT